MSEALQGNVPELEGDALASSFIIVVATATFPGDELTRKTLIGSLRSIMSDQDTVELEFMTELDTSLEVLQGGKYVHVSFELHPGSEEPIMKFAEPHGVTGYRLFEIDYRSGMCTLLLQLRPEAPSYLRG